MLDALLQIGLGSFIVFLIVLLWYITYTLVVVAYKQWRRDRREP